MEWGLEPTDLSLKKKKKSLQVKRSFFKFVNKIAKESLKRKERKEGRKREKIHKLRKNGALEKQNRAILLKSI